MRWDQTNWSNDILLSTSILFLGRNIPVTITSFSCFRHRTRRWRRRCWKWRRRHSCPSCSWLCPTLFSSLSVSSCSSFPHVRLTKTNKYLRLSFSLHLTFSEEWRWLDKRYETLALFVVFSECGSDCGANSGRCTLIFSVSGGSFTCTSFERVGEYWNQKP